MTEAAVPRGRCLCGEITFRLTGEIARSACGSTLFFKATDSESLTSVMVGPIDDVSQLALGGVWFAGDAQVHHSLPAGVPHFEGNDDPSSSLPPGDC